MTREEAIAFFKDMNECTYGDLEAVEMAIKALEQEPCEDCISRQGVPGKCCMEFDGSHARFIDERNPFREVADDN